MLGLLRATKAALICVVATEVGTPEAVRVAMAALTSLNSTLAAAAAGATLNNAEDSSSKVVLPPLTAANIESATLPASPMSRPKALIVVVKPSTAVSTSVTPAIAALEATCINSRALSFGTPAESAW